MASIHVTALRQSTNIVFRLRAIEATTAATAAARLQPNLHIALLLDTSLSMEGARLDSVKRTLNAARPLLQLGDHMTVVTFSGSAETIVAAEELSSDSVMDRVFRDISRIRTVGATNLSAGFEELYRISSRYDVIILLTDGEVNAGITTTAGLRTIAEVGSATATFHTMGYGADHNRILLQELAMSRRGTYTYVDSEEILPIAIGDILAGARQEIAKNVRLTVTSGGGGITCQEVGALRSACYSVGAMIPGRDYWAVFAAPAPAPGDTGGTGSAAAAPAAEAPITYTVTWIDAHRDASGCHTLDGVVGGAAATSEESISQRDIKEQILRVRVACAMANASARIERNGTTDRTELARIQTEMDAIATELEGSVLALRLRAQIAEILALIDSTESVTTRFPPVCARVGPAAPAGSAYAARASHGASHGADEEEDVGGAGGGWSDDDSPPRGGGSRDAFQRPALAAAAAAVASRSHLMARLACGTAYLGNQRGVDSAVTNSDGACLFSSPTQRAASNSVAAAVTGRSI